MKNGVAAPSSCSLSKRSETIDSEESAKSAPRRPQTRPEIFSPKILFNASIFNAGDDEKRRKAEFNSIGHSTPTAEVGMFAHIDPDLLKSADTRHNYSASNKQRKVLRHSSPAFSSKRPPSAELTLQRRAPNFDNSLVEDFEDAMLPSQGVKRSADRFQIAEDEESEDEKILNAVRFRRRSMHHSSPALRSYGQGVGSGNSRKRPVNRQQNDSNEKLVVRDASSADESDFEKTNCVTAVSNAPLQKFYNRMKERIFRGPEETKKTVANQSSSLKTVATSHDLRQMDRSVSKQPPTFAASGFKTAAGKDVRISAGAMQRACSLLQEVNAQVGFGNDHNFRPVEENDTEDRFDGPNFSKISSKRSFQKDEDSMKLLKNDDSLSENTKFPVTGFRTAAEISMQIDELEEELPLPNNFQHQMGGFKTAGGKKITVSGAALEQAKLYFCDVGIDSEELLSPACDDKSIDMDDGTPCSSLNTGKRRVLSNWQARCGSAFKKPRRLDQPPRRQADVETSNFRSYGMELMDKLPQKLESITPIQGSMLKAKSEGRTVSLRQAFAGQSRGRYSVDDLIDAGMKPATISITIDTAEEFQFTSEYLNLNDELELHLAEGCSVQLNEGCQMSSKNLFKSFCLAPGVDPKLISIKWLLNHYKWIVWKLASFEVCFPHLLAGQMLTPDNVIKQLKYRYDREIDASQRSAIRKIVEKDDCARRPMVLCVSKVHEANETGLLRFIELTDGWYGIRTKIDSLLAAKVATGHISVGTKLFIVNANLNLSSTDGISPLDLDENCYLTICANSVRRARWWAKLGFQRLRSVNFPISSLHPDGGMAPQIDVMIVRIYPPLFMEKKAEGSNVIRTEAANKIAEHRHSVHRSKLEETIYKRVHERFGVREVEENRSKIKEAKRRWTLDVMPKSHVQTIHSPEKLHDLLAISNDPTALQALLTPTQNQGLERYQMEKRNEKEEAIRQELQKEVDLIGRHHFIWDVTPMIRLKIIGLHSLDRQKQFEASLTFWRPDESFGSFLKEGESFRISNVLAGSGALGSTSLELSVVSETRFKSIEIPLELKSELFAPRKVTPIGAIKQANFSPDYGELNIVGVVVEISKDYRRDLVYVCNEKFELVSVVFGGGLEKLGYGSLVVPGTFTAFENLAISQSEFGLPEIPTLFAGDRSAISAVIRANSYLKPTYDALCCAANQENNGMFLVNARRVLNYVLERNRMPTQSFPMYGMPNNDESLNANSRQFRRFQGESEQEFRERTNLKRMELLDRWPEPPIRMPNIQITCDALRKPFRSPLTRTV